MKEKKKLNQNTFLLLVTILLFFVMYAIGCVLFNAQGFAKTQNFLNLFISNAGLIVIGIGMTIVMITGCIDIRVGSFVAMGCLHGYPAIHCYPGGYVLCPRHDCDHFQGHDQYYE